MLCVSRGRGDSRCDWSEEGGAAVVMLLGEQVVKADGVKRPAAALRLLILRVVPLFHGTKQD